MLSFCSKNIFHATQVRRYIDSSRKNLLVSKSMSLKKKLPIFYFLSQEQKMLQHMYHFAALSEWCLQITVCYMHAFTNNKKAFYSWTCPKHLVSLLSQDRVKSIAHHGSKLIIQTNECAHVMKCLNPIQTGCVLTSVVKNPKFPPKKNINGITTSLLFCKGKGM